MYKETKIKFCSKFSKLSPKIKAYLNVLFLTNSFQNFLVQAKTFFKSQSSLAVDLDNLSFILKL